MNSFEYVAEEKIDGCHYMTIENRFFSTHVSAKDGFPVERTQQVDHLSTILMKIGMPKVILDGELYVPGKKSNDVSSIIGGYADRAMAMQKDSGDWVQYRVFDILRDAEGNWLFNMPWKHRRAILEGIGAKLRPLTTRIQVNKVIYAKKQQALEQIWKDGGEGIVLKHVEGLYYPGARPAWNWVKLKQEVTEDVVIIGFEPPEKLYGGQDFDTWLYWEDGVPVTKYHSKGWIGAISFGQYNKDGTLVPLGTCSGFDETTRAEFSRAPELYIGQVMEIKAMEKTRDGFFRHPNYVRMHSDKNALECIIS